MISTLPEVSEAMFERYNDRARRIIVLAQSEARLLNHHYIGTEHLLLGLMHEGEGVAAKVLEELGLTLEVLRADVEELIGQGQEVPSGHVQFTVRCKQRLELSLREALRLDHNYIGTEHLLLGLVRRDDGVAMQLLTDHGITADVIRERVLLKLGVVTPSIARRLVLQIDFPEELLELRDELGENDPQFKTALANFFEQEARRLRREASD